MDGGTRSGEDESVRTVGIVGVDVGAGDVPPLDGGVDAAAETLFTCGGHRQRQHWAPERGEGIILKMVSKEGSPPEFIDPEN